MIVDAPVAYDLTLGQRGRIPSSEDAQVVIPPVITPVALTLAPHLDDLAPTAVLNASSYYFAQLSRTNQPAAQVLMATLAAGLYELELSLATFANFSTPVGSFVSTAILVDFGSFQKPVIKRLAAPGSFTDYNRLRLLMRTQWAISIEVGLTGAAQSLDGSAHVNVIRIL